MTYLTAVWGLHLTSAVAMVNIWRGISSALAPLFVFIADTFFGNYVMLLISGMSYTIGLGFLSMSTPPVTGTCSEYLPQCIGSTQEALFYTGLVLISIGIAGHNASLFSFIKDQNKSADQNDPPFSRRTLVFSIILTIVLYFIKPWSLQFGIPAIFSLIASLLFLSASSSYNKKKPLGNPLKAVFRFDWPFASKTLVLQQYHDDPENRCEDQQHRRKLSRAKEVDQETKLAFGAIPIWIAFIICGLVSCFGDTFFQEQADKMYRQIGKLKISLEIILLVYELAKLVFEKLIKKLESGGAPPFGMEALLFSLLCCIMAAKVETLRLDVIRTNELQDYPEETIPMSVFWLLPQYVLLAGLDTFFEKSVAEYFRSRVPSSLQNYARPIGYAVSGLGSIASPLLVFVVGKISEIAGNPNWFQDIINWSRLDNYYWTLAAFSAAPLVLYLLIAIIHFCRKPLAEHGKEFI